MNYQYKVIVNNQNFYQEYEIPGDADHVKLGTTPACEFRMDPDKFFGNLEILLDRREGWRLTCPDQLYISRGDIRKLFYTDLKHGDVFSVYYSQSGELAFRLRFLIDFEAKVPKYDWYIDLEETPVITIGDQSGSNVELESEFGQNTLVVMEKKAGGVQVTEKQSQLGVNINGRRMTAPVLLKDYDFISVADFFGCYRKGRLYFCHRSIRTNGIKKYYDQVLTGTTYPKFVRNTRLQAQRKETPIPVLDPPDVPKKPELNLVTSLLPALAMFALVVLLRGVMSTTSILSILEKRKHYKQDCQKRRETYLHYIEKKRQEIGEARDEELDCLRQQYYSTQEDAEHIRSFSPALFDRTPEDEDFLEVYLGEGTARALRTIEYKVREKLEAGDDLCRIPGELADICRDISPAPVVVGLRDANAVGIVGEEQNRYHMMKLMLLDLVSRHYMGDLKLYFLLDRESHDYDWLQLLPGIQTEAGPRRIVCDGESKNNIFENLYKELTDSEEKKESEDSCFRVVFVLAEHDLNNHPISRFIERASERNTVFLFFEPSTEVLPLHCSRIIEIDSPGEACVYEAQNKTERTSFRYTEIPDRDMGQLVEILAPVYCDKISLEGALRKSISLFELLGIYDVRDLNLKENWEKARIYESMAVPLGVNVKDEAVYLDIHEKHHGPHGLVAGTTGSGKSEILQTFILGAATLFHPYEIGFLIIDFKGGGMVNQFKALPHLMGAITNIDGKAMERSLKSMKAELLKRQTLFARAGVNHIDKYIRAYKEGKVDTALPHLVIVVDEFAELKAEQPEFMKELISAARIGRSLGVHLILATQKPAGQVNDQIWSNSKFKLCLKVQTQEDSNEVLKSPLAAEIREPGRAYLQVGNNEIFELLQSGYSGSPEKSEEGNQKAFDICSLDFKGEKTLIYRQRPEKTASARTQLEAVTAYIHDYCEASGIRKLPDICLPPLKSVITYDPVFCDCGKDPEMGITVGLYDDPDHQIQDRAIVPVGSSNLLIIGSAQYGKTNLLETIIRGIAERYTPREVNLYLIDFASMALKNLENLAHVGGVVCPADDEKLKNLLKYLSEQIDVRRERMLAAGVSSFQSYKEAGYGDFPQIVLFIDNFTALKDLFLQDNDSLLNLCREGISVGISVVVANAQTSGLGYKYLANFASRMVLFCNEPSEYTSVLGGCRMRPDETPGRCLMEIDKTIYECQTFLAFEGEREIERIQNMQKFVKERNALCREERAVPIPEIPKLLSESYLLESFPGLYRDGRQILGIGYDTVTPVVCETESNNLLTVCGGEKSGKANFIKYMAHVMEKTHPGLELYIFDNYKKKLEALRKDSMVYEVAAEACGDVLLGLDANLQNEYQKLIAGEEPGDTWRLLILNNEDVFQAVSADKTALAALRNLTGKYRMLHILVILGNVPNIQVVYGVPEIYKMVKESRNLLFFDNLENCKLVDVPLAVIRRNKKKIETGDAFYLAGNECWKIKTPLALP